MHVAGSVEKAASWWLLALALGLGGCGPRARRADVPQAATPQAMTETLSAKVGGSSGEAAASDEGSVPAGPLPAPAFDEVVARRRRSILDSCAYLSGAPGSKQASRSETVRLRVTVTDGRVKRADAEDATTPRVECVRDVIARWEFPRGFAPTEHRLSVMFVGQ